MPGLPASEGVRWESAGDGEFTVETLERAERGTTIVLHLKDDAKEFLDAWRLRSLVRRYSDHIAFPVRMPKEGAATLEYEAVNRGTALWARPKGEIKDEEYREFYQHLTHDSSDPLAWSHNSVEGKRDYTSLLYMPPPRRSTCGSATARAGSSCTCGASSSWTTPSSSCRCTCASSKACSIRRTCR